MRKLTTLIILLLALIMVLPVAAQDDVADEPEEGTPLIEITGEMTFDEEDNVFVAGVPVAPSSAFNPSDFDEGDIVTVTGYMLNDDDGTLKATGIILECAVDDEDCVVEEAEDCVEGDEGCAVEEPEDVECAEGDEECANDDNVHPVVTILAEEFDVPVEEIMALRDDGMGIGNISRALALAAYLETDLDDVFAQLEDADNFNALLKELDISPSELAPGQAISNSHSNRPDRDDDQPGNSGNNDNGHDNNGNNGHGNSHNDNNGNGNNKNKDKDK
jgi:hypothetical protein